MEALQQYTDSDQSDTGGEADERESVRISEVKVSDSSKQVVDYLGLNSDNDDDDDEAGDVGSSMDAKSPTETKILASYLNRKNYNLKRKNSESCQEQGNNLPKTQFWQGLNDVADWTDHSKIWKQQTPTNQVVPASTGTVSSLGKANSPATTETNDFSTKPKMIKFEKESDDKNTATSQRLEKSCFYVHHKTGPFLNENVTNRPPVKPVVTLSGHSGPVNSVSWCVAQYSHLVATACMDSSVRIWNAFSRTGHQVQQFCRHRKAVRQAAWSPDGRQVLSCGFDRTARLADVEKGTEISCFNHSNFLTCLSYHPVTPHVFLTGSVNAILCWDSRQGVKPTHSYTYKDKFGQVEDLVFVPDGTEFFTCCDVVSRDSADRNLMAWDYRSTVLLSNQMYQERYTCTKLRIHPHQGELAAQSNGDYIGLFSTIRPYKLNKCKRFQGHKVGGYKVGFDYSPDGRLIASGSHDGRVVIYDHHTGRSIRQVRLGQEVCMDVGWHPVLANTVAVSTWSGNVYVLK